MHVPAHAARQTAGAVQFACCITLFPAVRGWFLLRWQVSCTKVCSVAARGTGRVVVDQVVRLDRLPGDLKEPAFPALGGLGRLNPGQQVLPA